MAEGKIQFDALKQGLVERSTNVETKLEELRNAGDSMSIAEMFDMQWKMQSLQQFSELSTQITAGAHQALQSIARNVKG